MIDPTVLYELPPHLVEERGMPGVGVSIKRRGEKGACFPHVGDFLSLPENQSGDWYIDGGWGGPPGPVRVRWTGDHWINLGFPPWDEDEKQP